MTDPAAAWLGYALLPDSAHTIKGRRSVGTSTVAGTANASSQPQAVYGQTAGTQYVAPGAFADAITVSVTY
jgi:spore coat protein U-like protein